MDDYGSDFQSAEFIDGIKDPVGRFYGLTLPVALINKKVGVK